MNYNDQCYIDLYIQRRRLMTLGTLKNKEGINILTSKLDTLRASGTVSEKVIRNAAWVPWR